MKSKPKLIILFGSQVDGSASGRSDTDVAILADHQLSLEEKAELAAKISGELGVHEDDIDLVDLWNASPLLQYQVAERGIILEGEKFDFIRFRVLAWKRFLDTSKFRRLRSKSLKNYAKRNTGEKA